MNTNFDCFLDCQNVLKINKNVISLFFIKQPKSRMKICIISVVPRCGYFVYQGLLRLSPTIGFYVGKLKFIKQNMNFS